MRLRNGDKSDIKIEDAVINYLVVLVIFFVVYLLIFLLFYLIRVEEISAVERKNQIVAEYNTMSINDRKIVNDLLVIMNHSLAVKSIAEVDGLVEGNEELFLVDQEFTEIPKTAEEVWKIYWWPVGMFLIVSIYIVVFIYIYFANVSSAYHLADLPWDSWKLYFYVPALMCIFPAFIVSYFRLKKTIRSLEELDKLEISQALIPRKMKISAVFKREFETFCITYGSVAQHKRELDLVKRALEVRMNDLVSLGNKVKNQQKEISNIKQEIVVLENNAPTIEIDKKDISRKLEILKKVRGVMSIRIDRDKFIAKVAVRVEYDEKLYDFGDWELTLSAHSFKARVLRRGTRANWIIGKYPDYSYANGGFCFGGRSEEIQDYLNKYNYIEAMVIAVDCLHSVNSESDKIMIPKAFREIKKPLNVKNTKKKKRKELK